MQKPVKKAEKKDDSALLRASAKRLFESLMEQTADRIYIKDRKSRFIEASKALAQMHGFKDRHKLGGMTDFDLFSQEHAQQAYDDEQKIMETGEAMVNEVEKETWPDGTVTWVSSSKSPLYLSSGKLAGLIGISRDITAEKIAREKLAVKELRLRVQNETMRSDYDSASEVQRVMIPGRVPDIKDLKIAHLWKPMTQVGGDMINFPRNPNDRLLFFMGDVCGHGVTAAIYTVLIKYLTTHSAEVYNDNPCDFLNSLNEGITGRINHGFVTGLAGHFGPRKKNGNRELILSHAGHRQVLVHHKKEDRIELINLPNGTVMGLPGTGASLERTIELHAGDRFYAFTDGITEASNPTGEEFGMERVIAFLKEHQNNPVQSTIEALYDKVSKYTKIPDQQDDITILGFELT